MKNRTLHFTQFYFWTLTQILLSRIITIAIEFYKLYTIKEHYKIEKGCVKIKKKCFLFITAAQEKANMMFNGQLAFIIK